VSAIVTSKKLSNPFLEAASSGETPNFQGKKKFLVFETGFSVSF
jgi:hypothetical protein